MLPVTRTKIAKYAAVAVPLLAMVVMALLSNGVLQDDDLTHFAMSRWSWTYPKYLADDWGRPAFTVPYALVANIGPPGFAFALARLTTVCTCALAAYATWRVARDVVEPKWAWVAPAALLTMPLYFRLGYTTLTETIAALYAIGGTLFLLKDRTYLAAATFSLIPLARHEGVLVLPVVALLLAWRGGVKGWAAIPLLLAGELAWNVAKPLLGFPWNELPILRFASKGDPGHLGSGGPLHYVVRSAQAFGPAQAALATLGIGVLLFALFKRPDAEAEASGSEPQNPQLPLRRRAGPLPLQYASRVVRRANSTYRPALATIILCAGGALGMVLLQTYLYVFNTHESGGYDRFLLPAAPWTAVCVAAAVAWVVKADRRGLRVAACVAIGFALLAIWGLRWNHWSIWIGVVPPLLPIAAILLFVPDRPRARLFLTLMALLAVGVWIGSLRPHRLMDHQRLVIETLREMQRQHPDRLVVGDNPWTDYATDVARSPGTWTPNQWRENPDGGVIYLWDRDHSSVNLPIDELLAYPHRELELPEVDVLQGRPADDELRDYLRVFERLPGEAVD